MTKDSTQHHNFTLKHKKIRIDHILKIVMLVLKKKYLVSNQKKYNDIKPLNNSKQTYLKVIYRKIQLNNLNNIFKNLNSIKLTTMW